MTMKKASELVAETKARIENLGVDEHCASGGRSALAAATLKDMGYSDVAHLDGGFKAWTDAGRPVDTP